MQPSTNLQSLQRRMAGTPPSVLHHAVRCARHPSSISEQQELKSRYECTWLPSIFSGTKHNFFPQLRGASTRWIVLFCFGHSAVLGHLEEQELDPQVSISLLSPQTLISSTEERISHIHPYKIQNPPRFFLNYAHKRQHFSTPQRCILHHELQKGAKQPSNEGSQSSPPTAAGELAGISPVSAAACYSSVSSKAERGEI